jgi:hypothetical protein
MLVMENYCPSSDRGTIEKEFVNLEAGTLTHQQYTTKFNKMACLLPEMVKPESRRIERYILGLPIDIRCLVQSSRPTTFVLAVDLSRIMYRERGEVAPAESKKRPNFVTDNSNNNNDKRFNGNGSENKRKEWAECKRCGRKHPAECRLGSNLCFKCGKTGHLARDCYVNVGIKCFNCGEGGHMSRECPKLRKADVTIQKQ